MTKWTFYAIAALVALLLAVVFGETAWRWAAAQMPGGSFSMKGLWDWIYSWDWRTISLFALIAAAVVWAFTKSPTWTVTTAVSVFVLGWWGQAGADRYNSPSAPPGPSYAARTTPAPDPYDKCSRVVHEYVLVPPGGIRNPDPHNCGVRWYVRTGAVKPVGLGNTFGVQEAGRQNGDVRDNMKTAALVPVGDEVVRIDYQFCPGTHRSRSWC